MPLPVRALRVPFPVRIPVRIALCALALSAAAQAAPRRVFVTSVNGTGDLGSWPDAGPATGLAAGDAICQARAAAAGLGNASGFRAWLSSTTTDAYCRAHGLGGQRATNCGQPSLPAAAGPWVRTDGRPFGDPITELLEPTRRSFLPPRLDETGATVHSSVWTASDGSGAYLADSCLDWTSAVSGEFGRVGYTNRTATGWSGGGNGGCQNVGHLLCFETGVGDPLPPFANWGRLAFVTSALGNGDLGSWPQAGASTGLAAGNAICRTLAAKAGLPNATSYKAWLSSGTLDARDRFTHDGPWMRLDRVRVAGDLAGLTDALLNSPINLTETGEYIGNSGVWTGTDPTGVAQAETCLSWTASVANQDGGSGSVYASDASWTDFFPNSCDFPAGRLYCLQDLPLLFGDGFESGDDTVWTSSVP